MLDVGVGGGVSSRAVCCRCSPEGTVGRSPFSSGVGVGVVAGVPLESMVNQGPIVHLNPGADDVRFDAALIRAAQDAKVSILAPLRAPRIGAKLQETSSC